MKTNMTPHENMRVGSDVFPIETVPSFGDIRVFFGWGYILHIKVSTLPPVMLPGVVAHHLAPWWTSCVLAEMFLTKPVTEFDGTNERFTNVRGGYIFSI